MEEQFHFRGPSGTRPHFVGTESQTLLPQLPRVVGTSGRWFEPGPHFSPASRSFENSEQLSRLWLALFKAPPRETLHGLQQSKAGPQGPPAPFGFPSGKARGCPKNCLSTQHLTRAPHLLFLKVFTKKVGGTYTVNPPCVSVRPTTSESLSQGLEPFPQKCHRGEGRGLCCGVSAGGGTLESCRTQLASWHVHGPWLCTWSLLTLLASRPLRHLPPPHLLPAPSCHARTSGVRSGLPC